MSLVRKSRVKTPQKQDRSDLKNIVDPFLNWHRSLFASCLEEIKNIRDYSKGEESFGKNGSFEVNEETMYNILSADIRGNSKAELLDTYKILPVLPKSISKNLKYPSSAFPSSNEESFDNDYTREKSNSFERNSLSIRKKLLSDDFIDTEDMCKNLRHLKIIDEFINNSEEYLQFKKITKT